MRILSEHLYISDYNYTYSKHYIITYRFLEEKEINVLPRICIRSLDKSKDARIDIYCVNCIETFYYTFTTVVVSLLKCEF